MAGLGLRCPSLSSSPLGLNKRASSSSSRRGVGVPARKMVVSAVAISNAQTRERERLKELFEDAYERCRTSPLDGISFTVEDFNAALDKYDFDSEVGTKVEAIVVRRRDLISQVLLGSVCSKLAQPDCAFAEQNVFREYVDTFDGYSLKYPLNWIQVKGSGADIFFRDPFVLDENLSLEISSPSSSRYRSVEDLGPPQAAATKVLKQYLTEFMSTRLGVRRESSIVSASSKVAEDGKLYYQVEVNIKSYANNNELAVMPQDRVTRLEWDRRYLSVLGVENNRLYELRLQTPEKVFTAEEDEIRRVMDSFRVFKSVD